MKILILLLFILMTQSSCFDHTNSSKPQDNKVVNKNLNQDVGLEKEGFIDPDFLNTLNNGYCQHVTLEQAVVDFNTKLSSKACGIKQPPLTVDEIVASIRALKQGQVNQKFYKFLQEIADIKIIPRGTSITYLRGQGAADNNILALWQIYLLFDLDKCPIDIIFDKPCNKRSHVVRRQYIKVIKEGEQDPCFFEPINSEN